MNRYTHKVTEGTYLSLSTCGVVTRYVATLWFHGKATSAKTQPFTTAKAAERSGAALAKRYQAYYERTGRRWDAEQDEIRDRKRATRKAEQAARERIRNMAPELLTVVEDYVSDFRNGLGPDIERLASIATKIREG